MGKHVVKALLWSLFLASPVLADTLILNSGEQVRGKIMEETTSHVTVSVNGTAMSYAQDAIQRIVPDYGNDNDVPLPAPGVSPVPAAAGKPGTAEVSGSKYTNNESDEKGGREPFRQGMSFDEGPAVGREPWKKVEEYRDGHGAFGIGLSRRPSGG